MPEEPQNNEQQPEPTPHFDTFSEHANDPEAEIQPEPKTKPNPTFTPVQPEPTSTTLTPVQNGPMTSFAPNLVVDPEPTISPEQARVPEGINQNPQSIVPVISTEKPKWFKQKKFIIGIIAAVLIVLVGGGSVFAYVSNYQKPQNVVNDALMNALIAKNATYTGKISYDFGTDSSKIKAVIEIDSQTGTAGTQHHNAKLTMTVGTKSYSIQGDALFDKVGDVYFRVQGLKSVIDDAKSNLGITSGTQLSNSIDGIVKKIDGTWVRISTDDLDKYDKNFSKVKKCINESIDKFKNDNSAITEVADLYRKNPFVVVKKDLGNFEYDVTTDIKAGKAFVISLKTTKIYKSLNTCDKTIVINDKDINSISEDNNSTAANIQPVYKLSVNSWSHKMSKFDVSYSGDNVFVFSANITPNYDKKVDIATPNPSITLSQLQIYIQDIFTTLQDGNQL